MRKRLLLSAVAVLLIAIAVPVALAAVQQKQTVNVAKTDIKPTPTPTEAPTITPTPTGVAPTPIATPAPSAQPLEPSVVKYSLWYPNGTTYNLHQTNAPSVFGATGLVVNGVPVNIQSGLGAPPMGYTSGVIVVRNDGNVPINVNASLANISTPSGIVLTATATTINPSTWGSQVDGWMGRNQLATDNVVGVGQYAWLSVQVVMTNSTGNMGAIHSLDPIPYSFDVAVTASQA